MTKIEEYQLRDLSKKFNDYIFTDNKWKDDFEKKIAPIIKDRNDSQVIKDWWRTVFHVVAVLVGFLVSVAILIHYILEPLVNLKK